ncbi:hypothetical protein Plhal304r1_c040g0117851 [Plasmopara halstedii]
MSTDTLTSFRRNEEVCALYDKPLEGLPSQSRNSRHCFHQSCLDNHPQKYRQIALDTIVH